MLNVIVLKKIFGGRNKKDKIGSSISLPRGYARYLIQQGSVIRDTEKNRLISEKILAEEMKKKDEKISNAKEMKKSLENENISFIVNNCNGNGVLFGSITAKDIVNKIHSMNKKYTNIKTQQIILHEVIKKYNVYSITINLYDDISVTLPVYIGSSSENIGKMINQYKKTTIQDNKEDNSKEDSNEKNVEEGI